jgi:uncharacterized damage-inducible protein DinB
MTPIERPAATEYAEYYGLYIDRVPPGDVVAHLAAQGEATHALLARIDEPRSAFRYAPGKWSIKQLLGHVNDGERLFGYRALAFARKDPGALPSMEQDDWMAAADFDQRSFASLREEFRRVRQATLALFASFTPEVALRTGVASGNRFTVRSLMWIVAGHELHHLAVLRERYGVA